MLRPMLLLAAGALAFLGPAAVPQPPKVNPPIPLPRGTWPMYGGTPGRNMVNLYDRDILRVVRPDKGLPVRWKADLGSRSYAQPIVVGGRVFVGTNNERPRNKRDVAKNKDGEFQPIDKGILMCFDDATGKFLWQAVHDKLPNGNVTDWPMEGVCSSPTVEGDRVYYVSNQCRVVCADVNGFANGNQGFQGEKYQDATDADILWEFDMMKELGVFPHNMSTGCPLIVGDVLVTITSNGVDESHINIPSPHAPSLIALDKNTGKLLWKDNSPGKAIMHGQWAPPAFAAEPVPQVIVGQGDGWLRAFDLATGRLLWQLDCNPKGAVYELGGAGNKNDFIAAPVVHDGRVYIGIGQDPEHSAGIAHFWCVDLAKAVERGRASPNRDVSPTLEVPKAKLFGHVVDRPNPHSAVAWHFGGEERREWAARDFKFGRTMSTACVVDDIVYAAELAGYLHCLNAKTGHHYWQFDTKASIWGAPYYVDGKILLGTEAGDLFVFRHDPKPDTIDELDIVARDQKEARMQVLARRRLVAQKYLMMKFEFDAPIRGTPSVAGGVLYLATENTLYAFGRTFPDQ